VIALLFRILFYGAIPIQLTTLELVRIVTVNDWDLEEEDDYAVYNFPSSQFDPKMPQINPAVSFVQTRMGVNLCLLGTLCFLLVMGASLTFLLTALLQKGLGVERNARQLEKVITYIYKPCVILLSSIAVLITSRTFILIVLWSIVRFNDSPFRPILCPYSD